MADSPFVAHGVELLAAAGSEPFVYTGKGRPVTMSLWSAPADALDAPAAMVPWARLAIGAAPRARSPRSPRRR